MDKFRIDSGKLQFHPQWVARWLEADTWEKAKEIAPIYFEITTAANCSHRCSFCSVDAVGYPDVSLDTAILSSTLREGAALGVQSVMYAGTGEPLIHRHINRIVEEAYRAGLHQAFTTNGVLLHKLEQPNLCDWLKVSVNAGSSENYARIHRTKERDWTRVWSNIRDISQRKGECALGVQCVVLPENVHEMHDLALRARDHGADYFVLKPYSQATFSIVQRNDIDYRAMDTMLRQVAEQRSTDKFQVIYRENAMRQESEPHKYKVCHATPHAWVYAMGDGRIFTCSAHLMDERFCIGNLNDQSFTQIWQGEGRRRQWEMMKTFSVAFCRLNCRQNQNNIYLDQVKNGVPHRSFI